MKKKNKLFITAVLLFISISIIMCASVAFVASADSGDELNIDNQGSASGDTSFETPPDGHTTMVSGYITIVKDVSGTEIPLKNVKVSLWDKDPIVNDFIASTYTDENGFYQFFFQDGHGIFENKDDLQLRVFASGETFNMLIL